MINESKESKLYILLLLESQNIIWWRPSWIMAAMLDLYLLMNFTCLRHDMLVYTFMRNFRLIAWFSQVLLQLCHKSILDFGGHFDLENLFPKVILFATKSSITMRSFMLFKENLLILFCFHSIKFILKCDISGHFEFPLYFFSPKMTRCHTVDSQQIHSKEHENAKKT